MFFLKDDRCCCVLFTIGYDPTTRFFVFSKPFLLSIYKSTLLSYKFYMKLDKIYIHNSYSQGYRY